MLQDDDSITYKKGGVGIRFRAKLEGGGVDPRKTSALFKCSEHHFQFWEMPCSPPLLPPLLLVWPSLFVGARNIMFTSWFNPSQNPG